MTDVVANAVDTDRRLAFRVRRRAASEPARSIFTSDFTIFGAYALIFVIATWRLFAVNTSSQLFLYGDNLTALNNLYYLFGHFQITDPFRTFIGENGMGGSYPMSEPQNSIFYPPIFAAFLLSKVVGVSAASVYYSLLVIHVLHVVVGAFFVFRIAGRILNLQRSLAFFAGITYIGLGWNVGWFGTNTLSFMTGLIPVVAYTFIRALMAPTRRAVITYTLVLGFALYAGAAVNYLFYVWLNTAIAFAVVAVSRRRSANAKRTSLKQIGTEGAGLLVLAPLLALALYAPQLLATSAVSHDITRSAMQYDDVSVFGLHFGDLVGVFLPKFGMTGFGTTMDPTLDFGFVAASLMYVGMLPLFCLLAVFAFRSKRSLLLVAGVALNGMLAFGGMFVLYDATLLFPGNSHFRGHYKYLTLVGLYLALLSAVVLDAIVKKRIGEKAFRRFLLFGFIGWAALLSATMLLGIFAWDAHATTDTLHYDRLASALHQSVRTLLFAGAALVAFLVLKRFPKPVVVLSIGLVLLLDTSVNNKLLVASDTKLLDLSSSTFFACCSGKSVVNSMDGLSQLYSIPEVFDVDVFPQYSAIANKYVTDVSNQMLDASSQPRAGLFRAAGVDGVLTTGKITATDFKEQSSVAVTPSNVEQYYHYNTSGTIQTTWKGLPPLVGVNVSYYEMKNPVANAYIVSSYLQDPDPAKAITFLTSTLDEHPAFVTGPLDPSTTGKSAQPADVAPTAAEPTRTQYRLPSVMESSVLVTHVPYSRVWSADLNGKRADTVLVNGGFVGVKLPAGSSGDVVLQVAHTSMNIALIGAIVLLLTLAVLLRPARLRR